MYSYDVVVMHHYFLCSLGCCNGSMLFCFVESVEDIFKKPKPIGMRNS